MRGRIAEVGGAFGVAEAEPNRGPEKRQERELKEAARKHQLHPELRIVAARQESRGYLHNHGGNDQRAKENAPVQVPATQALSPSELAQRGRCQAVGCRHKHRITSPGPGFARTMNPKASACEWLWNGVKGVTCNHFWTPRLESFGLQFSTSARRLRKKC